MYDMQGPKRRKLEKFMHNITHKLTHEFLLQLLPIYIPVNDVCHDSHYEMNENFPTHCSVIHPSVHSSMHPPGITSMTPSVTLSMRNNVGLSMNSPTIDQYGNKYINDDFVGLSIDY